MPRTAAQKLDRIYKDLVDSVDDLRDSRRLQAMGNFTAHMIRDRTREGKGVKRVGGSRSKLKRLSPLYIAFRKRYSKRLDKTTRPGKSNLTFTGQMLASMRAKVKKDRVIIGPHGKRDEGGSNERVAIWVQKQGRPFLFLGRAEHTKLLKFYKKTLDMLLRGKTSLR